jgi:DNA-directed RNA polymerase sigma subunit (sigma70/sigma32)
VPNSPLDDARKGLVTHNQGLAPFLAGGYRNQAKDAGILFDDLVGEAYLGLCVGASRFDPDLVDLELRRDADGNDEDDQTQINRVFCCYVGKWIHAALLRAIALALALPTVLLDPDSLVDVPDEETLSDRAMQRLWDAIDDLPRKDRQILLRKFGLGGVQKLTLLGIQAKLSVTPKMIRKSVLRSLEAIAAHIKRAQ